MNWEFIIIHHSLTKDNKVVNWQAIRDYHIKHFGWSDIGYHFGIERVSCVYQVCIGRPLTQPGAHTVGMNNKAIGICLVGNYDEESPSPEQYLILASLVRCLMKKFSIPIANIKGHRDYSLKTCPGKNFSFAYLKSLIKYCA